MWERRKLLLATVVFSAVFYGVSADLLDKTPNTEEYKKCRKEDLKEVIDSGQLGRELNHSTRFQGPWSSYIKCSKPIPGGQKEHAAALAAYANADDYINSFNKTVEHLLVNVSTYENSFPFKALHFLLMDALMLLRSNNCKTVYFVTEKEYKVEPGSLVRFSTFKTVYQSMDSLENDVEDLTVFNITTCFFAVLGDNDCVRNKKVALVSPAEQFIVEGVHPGRYKDADYTEIVLKHSKVLSFHKCCTLSRSPADVPTQWLVSLLVTLSLFFCYS